MADLVRLEVGDGVALIHLDKPPANAIDLALGLALQDAIRTADGTDRSARSCYRAAHASLPPART